MPDRFEWPPQRGEAPDPIEDLRRLWERFRGSVPGGVGSRLSLWPILAIVLLLYAASGVYIVAPDERGVVLRFGRVVGETDSGPHYHLPWPIEQVIKPGVTQIRKEEIGFRTVSVGPPAKYREIDAEALMLTGDENIVKLEFIVQFKVRPDASGTTDFLFNVRDPEETVRASAEAAMREVIGRTKIDDAMTEGRLQVEEDALKQLQLILDHYQAGIQVAAVKLQDVGPPDQVSDAFKDVISAQQDKERMINEARGYAYDVVPKARGEAARLLNEAAGYAEAKVRESSGAAQRFVAVQQEYAKAREVTRRRLYLETMEVILPRVNKIILDEAAGKQTVPYLPLDSAMRPLRSEPAPEPVAPPAQGKR